MKSMGAGSGMGFDTGLALLTIGLSNTMSAGAAVAVMAPVVLKTAVIAGEDPLRVGFLTAMASAFGYLTPAAQPAFTIIFSLQVYLRSADFFKIGIRMMVLSFIVLLLTAGFYWAIACAMKDLLKRSTLSERQEAAVEKTLQNLRAQRRSRFRILACVDGNDESELCVRFAARFAVADNCDIINLHIRPIDQGLHSGGLQVRLARQNMMEAGFELPGVKHMKRSLDILKEEGIDAESWAAVGTHENAWGDAAGDTKVEYRDGDKRSVVLKLKTAPDVAARNSRPI